MREILFRGRTLDGDWIEGWYQPPAMGIGVTLAVFNDSSDHLTDIQVIPETVGQFTGLLDKNGTKIFEGDILKYTPRPNCEIFYRIDWQQEWSRFSLIQWSTHKYQLYEWAEESKVKYMCEIIGNVHDAPELLTILEAKK